MTQQAASVDVSGPIVEGQNRILTEQALSLVGAIGREFRQCRRDALSKRQDFQQKLYAGGTPRFLAETADVHSSEWKVHPTPSPLLAHMLGYSAEIIGVSKSNNMVGSLPCLVMACEHEQFLLHPVHKLVLDCERELVH